MYPPDMVAPMKTELTSVGFDELTTAEDVDQALSPDSGTVLVMINSVCGCAAGSARPAVRMAVENSKIPSRLTTVFAGVDQEATSQARKYHSEIGGKENLVKAIRESYLLGKDGKEHVMDRYMLMMLKKIL